MDKAIHHGRNIKRFREMLGIKQEALADLLGKDWSQKRVSLLEGKDEVEAPLLAEVAAALKIPVDAIESFDENVAFNVISNTFNDHAVNMNYQCSFNPLDKYVEAIEDVKKLYERLLQSEREKVELLQALIKK